MEYTVNYYVKCSLLCAIGRNKGVNGTSDHTFIYTYKHTDKFSPRSDMFHLGTEFHTELSPHRSDYTFFKSDDLFRICLTGMIHYHQRLLIPDRRTTAALSFPATLFDHPGCGDFYHRGFLDSDCVLARNDNEDFQNDKCRSEQSPHSERSEESFYKKKTGVLLDIVLKGGNFGVYSKDRENASHARWVRKIQTFKSLAGNVRFAFRYAPKEWFWTIVQLLGGQFR